VLDYFRQLIARFRSHGFPPLWPPTDPPVGVRHPARRRGPNGRAAVALDEPDDDRSAILAVGGRRDGHER